LIKKLRGDLNESISFDVMGKGIKFEGVSSNPIVISDRNSKGLDVKLEFEKSVYKVGDSINGIVVLQNGDASVRGLEVILTATEYATASGKPKQPP
jgi:hypothetical protein